MTSGGRSRTKTVSPQGIALTRVLPQGGLAPMAANDNPSKPRHPAADPLRGMRWLIALAALAFAAAAIVLL
ncbi:MAG: hypothetical protein ACKVSF_00435 [Alphaproteobacteria bacterium]